MMRYLFSFLQILASVCLGRAVAADISGRVVDAFGNAVSKGHVVFSRQAEYTRDPSGRAVLKDPGASGQVLLEADGSFAVERLPAGSYIVCAYSFETYLSGCGWDLTPAVSIGEADSVRGLIRRVYKSSEVVFRVNDALGRILMPDPQGRIADPSRRFFVGVVTSTGRYFPAIPQPSSDGEKVFRLRAPKGETLRMFVDSELIVTDGLGAPLERGTVSRSSFSVSDAQETTVELSVR
jgi:hypothetical protein